MNTGAVGAELRYGAFNADVATEVINNVVNQRETQAGAFTGFFGGEKRLEYLVLQLLIYAGAVICDRNMGASVINLRVDGNHCIVGAGVSRIRQQIDENLC